MSSKLEMKVVFAAIDNFVRPVKNITDASRGASKALNEAKASLKGLNDQQKQIDKFRSVNKSLGINGQDLEKARAYAKKLGEELQQTEKPTAAMQRAFKHATDEARHLAGTVNRLREQKQRLRQELGAVGIDTKALATSQKDLKGKIDAATSAVSRQDEALKKANKRMQLMYAARAEGDKLRAMGARAGSFGRGAMAAGAGVGAIASVPVLAYAKAEEASTELKVAMMQKGGRVAAEFAQIDDLAKRLGNKLPGTTADFQNMMTMLIRQGMPAKNILGGLGEATAFLSVQLKMAPEAAAEFASKLQDATRTVDKDMMSLMDTIQRSSNLGVTQNNMLAGFAKLSPALSIIKREGAEAARELAPLLVMTDQAGMAGEAAGNAYRKIFQLAMDAKKVSKGNAELAGTGVKLDFTNGKGEFGGLDKMYAQLERLRGVSTQKRLGALKSVFGDDAETLQALSVMIEKGRAGYDQVQGRLAEQASLQERVNAQLGTLSKLWDAASGTFTNALVSFGESVAPELHATAEWLGRVAEKTQQWAQANPGLSATLMTIAKWGGLTLIAIGGIAVAISTIAAPIALLKLSLAGVGLSLGGIGSALLAVGRLFLLNPIGLAITGIVAGVYLIYKHWEPITGFFRGAWNGVSTVTKLAWNELKQWFSSIPEYFVSIGKAITDGLWGGLKSGFSWVMEKLGRLAQGLPKPVETALDVHSPSRVFERIGGYTMQGLEQGIDGAQHGPLAAMSGIARKVAAIGAGAAIISGHALATPTKLDLRPPIAQASVAGSNTTGGNTFIFHIHPSQGMDERALAEAVRNQFVRFTSEQEARKRSRLRDLE